MYIPALPVENGLYFKYKHKLFLQSNFYPFGTNRILPVHPHGLIISELSANGIKVPRIILIDNEIVPERLKKLNVYMLTKQKSIVTELITDASKVKNHVINGRKSNDVVFLILYRAGYYYVNIYNRNFILIKTIQLPAGMYLYDAQTSSGDLAVNMYTQNDGYVVYYIDQYGNIKKSVDTYYTYRTIKLPHDAVPAFPYYYAKQENDQITIYNHNGHAYLTYTTQELNINMSNVLYFNLGRYTFVNQRYNRAKLLFDVITKDGLNALVGTELYSIPTFEHYRFKYKSQFLKPICGMLKLETKELGFKYVTFYTISELEAISILDVIKLIEHNELVFKYRLSQDMFDIKANNRVLII